MIFGRVRDVLLTDPKKKTREKSQELYLFLFADKKRERGRRDRSGWSTATSQGGEEAGTLE